MSHSCADEAKEHDHHHHHHHDCDHTRPEDYDSGDSLYQYIDVSGVICLNEEDEESCKKIFRPWHERLSRDHVLKSDADADLLLYVPFTADVSIQSFQLVPGPNQPNLLKFWVNRESMNFDDKDDVAVQTFDNVFDDIRGEHDYFLKKGKFNNVRSLYIFLTDSNDEDGVTELMYLGFKGKKTANRQGAIENVVYEARAVPKDHKSKAEDAQNHMIQ